MGIRGEGFQAEGPVDAKSLRSAHGPCAQRNSRGRVPGAQKRGESGPFRRAGGGQVM